MTSSSNPTSLAPPHGATPVLAAALVWHGEGEARAYPLFDTVASRDGALFLAGAFFLEVDEEATIEFRLTDGPVRARARVLQVVRGETPGMLVTLIDADEAISARISTAAGAAG
jgi:hypothetical protein